ncbi:HAMP domain-containing histidine kinase [Deinococcus sp. Arct2-2]|uniref:sensor histidine kinase n=1 Tax=Deinococcus sp. Arct2-2 TaxID=2568653 RepID=UPI0010A453D4|nr:HAMP domain-containing sensor histidine kinase [Deinococcus sp. Arct2-2]THF68261.1 HAMP domain-containing histidine kinase [Deinococcus sp. Arct2-2]
MSRARPAAPEQSKKSVARPEQAGRKPRTVVTAREVLLAALPALLTVLLLTLVTRPAYTKLLENDNGWSPYAYQALVQDILRYQVGLLDPAQPAEELPELRDHARSSSRNPGQFTSLARVESYGDARLATVNRLLLQDTAESVAAAGAEAILLNSQANNFGQETGGEYFKAISEMRYALILTAIITGLLSMLLTVRALWLWRTERERRSQREARQREALSLASHELRRPLQSLMLASDLLRHAETPEQRQHLLTLIEDSATQLASRADLTRLNDLYLDVTLKLMRTDLRPLVLRAAETGGRVTAAVPDAPLIWPVDINRARQVIENLVENALKYTSGPVNLTLSEQDGQPEIDVRDFGPGIAPELREQLFLPYERGPSGLIEGHGLGLSLVRRYARAHGGDVTLHTPEDGAGTLVRVRFGTPLLSEQSV